MYSKEKGSLLPLDVPSIQSNPILKHSSERQKTDFWHLFYAAWSDCLQSRIRTSSDWVTLPVLKVNATITNE